MRRGRFIVGVAGAALGVLGYLRLVRPWQQNWGAGAAEVRAAMPGDAIVPSAWMSATRAVSIDAPATEVWPWLVQMGGYTRAGWYSWDAIDNGGRPSAESVRPDLQDLRVGDVMATTANGEGFRVEAIDVGRSMVLAIRYPEVTISSVFALHPEGAGRTRLVNRVRMRPRRWRGLALWLGMDTAELLMARRMLLGIRRRAEGRLLAGGARADRVTGAPSVPR